MNRALFLAAVRALAAFGENSSIPDNQILFLRNHARAEDADLPIEELCCQIIQREIEHSKLVREGATSKRLTPEIGQTLDEVERAHVERIFRHANNNISKAARILGIDRSTLYSKLRKYRIGE